MHSTLSNIGDRPSRPIDSEGSPKPSNGRFRDASWLKTSAASCAIVFVLGVFFAYLYSWPIWHTDVWGHLAYGRSIWRQGEIPATEPFMPLSKDVPLVDTAWLTQVLGYFCVERWETPALHFLFAASVTLTLAALARAIFVRCHQFAFVLIGLVVFVAVSWEHLEIIRPQLAGVFCFACLLVMLTARHWTKSYWGLLPLLFALWANVHGSFLVGLTAIGCLLVGRIGDLLWRTKELRAVVRDTKVRRWLAVLVLAAGAVLINPYGVRIYSEVLTVSTNPNLSALVEWGPLTFRMRQGRMFALAALTLIFLYRISPRRVSFTEVLLLVGLGGATLWTSRMIVWFAPAAAYYVALHASAWWHRRVDGNREFDTEVRLAWTLRSVAIACIFVVATPTSMIHLRKGYTVSPYTPVGVAGYFYEHPPKGQMFNSYEWGDYLIWAEPEGKPVFVASHAHLVPRQVWTDYLHVINVGSAWESTLEAYDVKTVVVNSVQHNQLDEALRRSPGWTLVYDNHIGAVFERNKNR